MTLVSIILTAGTLRMVGIVEAQRDAAVWFGFIQPVAFVLVFIGGLAETNRLPFDLPEAETELTGGFHTEYSGMRFSLFFAAEYANVIVISAVMTVLFLGGWLRPFPNVSALSFLELVPSWIWFRDQDLRISVPLHLDTLHAAAVSVRPADELGMEGLDSDRHCEPGGHRCGQGVRVTQRASTNTGVLMLRRGREDGEHE